MSYLDEHGLARYDGLIKNWVTLKSGTVDGVDPLLNWQKTGTAGAVTFYPLPAAPVDPTVNFLFSETGPASGTKGPDNPSTITGVSSVKVTRCGKNLIPFPYGNTSETENGIQWTVNDDKSITANGTATADEYFYIVYSINNSLLREGLTYTISGCPSGGSSSTYCLRYGSDSGSTETGGGKTFVADARTMGKAISIKITSGTTVSNLIFKPQLELGSTATTFEPYEGSDYTVNLGSTFYGGSVDFSTGTMTVTWERDVCTSFASVDAISTNTVAFRYNASRYHQIAGGMLYDRLACNRFPVVDDSSDAEHCRFSGAGITNTLRFYINKTRLDVSSAADPSSPTNAEWVAAANTWLASHPTSFVYILDTSYTVPLTPTQIYSLSQLDPYTPRLNAVYSDQVSVQVGYPKSPQATQNELTSAIVSLGGNV